MQDVAYEKVKIGDLGRIVTGRTPPSSKPECFGEKYPFITPGDMHDRKSAATTERYLSEEGAELLKRNLLPTGSIAVSCIGWQMGKTIKVTRPSFSNQQLNTIIPNEGVDSDYLYYLMVTKRQELFSLGSASGVRTPILNKSAFSNIDILIPDVAKQREVAEILSAYDNLIENNNRRIAILEEMAQSLYREWFVKFRFPGYENAKFIDSPLGKIPEGWEVKLLNEVSDNFDRMRKPLSKMQRENRKGEFPYYGAAKVFDYIDDYIFDGQYLLMAEDGSVVTPKRTPVLQMAYGRFWANNHTHILRGSGLITTDHLYLALNEVDVTPYITGAAQPKISQSNMNRIQILVPKELVASRFNLHIQPMFQEMHTLKKKSDILKKQRDLALPKLITGVVSL